MRTTKDTFERAYSVSANEFASPEFGFDSWFDECVVVNSTAYYPEALDTRETAGILDHFRSSLGHEHPVRSVANGVVRAAVKTSERLPVQQVLDDGGRSIHRASTRLLADGPEPSFLFVNMMDAHDPLRLVRGYRETYVERTWSSHNPYPAGTEPRDESFFEEYPDYAETYRSVYRAAVEYLDRRVATFIEDVQQTTEKETTFVITADHGQNLGYVADDRLIGHNQSLSEGLLHVPLDIVNPPDRFSVEPDTMVSHLQLKIS